MNEFETACAEARVKADAERRKFWSALRRDTERWTLEPADERFLALISNGRMSDRALLSNEHVHRRAEYALIDAAVADFKAYPQRQCLWITICWDNSITWERAPDIDTVSLRNTVGAHLRRCGLDGFGVLEIDIWKNFTGEHGRRVVPHIHFLGYPTWGDRYNVEDLQSRLRERSALVNSLGDDVSVVIKEVGLTPADFARIVRYMLKPPTYAKLPVPKEGEDRFKLLPVTHARGSVARLVEIFSHLELRDILFSIGEGRTIACAVRKAVAEEVRFDRGKTPAPAREDVPKHWNRMRLLNGSPQFEECRIITRSKQRTTVI